MHDELQGPPAERATRPELKGPPAGSAPQPDTSPGAVAERKSEVRKLARASRLRRLEAMSSAHHDAAAQHIARRTLELLDQLTTAMPTTQRTVALYVAYGSEPPTHHLLQSCLAKGWRVLLPVLLEDRDLDWVQAHDPGRPLTHPAQASEAVDSVNPAAPRLGLAAIAEAHMVVVPALAVDRAGTRLGQGGGSYDRALARLPHGRPIVAVLWDDEFISDDLLPCGEWDRPVTIVVSPERIVTINPKPEAQNQSATAAPNES